MRYFHIAVLILGSVCAVAQEVNFWHVLAEVGFKKTKTAGGEMEVPIFSAHLKEYHGKKIKLKGFVIPVSETGDESKFMLSSLPFNVCYFCGAAGPETIVEVESNQKVKFTSQAIWMEGILYLNDKDPDHHIYMLKSARIIQSP
ncbi:MAG: DUF3299 domain-containing protein [Cyclobacteriaceae bacterium]|nr:DUF3299 domain-containing protein [Cyclobacteriaceae bacterium]